MYVSHYFSHSHSGDEIVELVFTRCSPEACLWVRPVKCTSATHLTLSDANGRIDGGQRGKSWVDTVFHSGALGARWATH